MRAAFDGYERHGVAWFRAVTSFRARSAATRAVRFERAELGGVDTLVAEPAAGGVARSAFHLHGGGFVTGTFDFYRDTLARLALACRARVFAPGYRLSPEHRFPAAQDDAFAAWRGLLASGVAPSRTVVSGDSAGGGLALALLQRLRDAGDAQPAAALLLSPWVEPLADGGSMRAHAAFDIGERGQLVAFLEAHLGPDGDGRHPWVSPVDADLRGLPPLRAQVGGAELLLDQVRLLGARARAAGVDAVVAEYEDGFHGFHGMADFEPVAARAWADLGRWAREAVPEEVQP